MIKIINTQNDKTSFLKKISSLLTLLGFLFSHEVKAQSEWDYNLRDLNGTLLITNKVQRYRDTLVFEHP